MATTLLHRGPDDAGTWADSAAGVALGHRRLAIIDLSPAGHQPMVSASGRYVLVYNGEIYNHFDVRAQLEAGGATPAWRGHSDTETLLVAIDHWGLEAALQKSAGMFALALWDRQERALTLARDRMGEKPLYYGWQGDTLLFGSELKALRAHPAFAAEVDRSVLALYLQRGFVPAPHSIYADISKLGPGTSVTFGPAERAGDRPREYAYWSLDDAVAAGRSNPFVGSAPEAADELERLLGAAVGLQSVADVPLGAFLSGGIDSTTVVALMQKDRATPVKTFTIGFHEAGFNEAEHAKAVAKHLGTQHTELYVTAREAMEVIPDLPAIYDEPFGDSSAIPTALVSRLAREHVTVSLSGDGGDELFCGYTRYERAQRAWRKFRATPGPLREPVARALDLVALGGGATRLGRKGAHLGRHLRARTFEQCYALQMQQRYDTATLVRGAERTLRPGARLPDMLADDPDLMLYLDARIYLPDDILTKVDRAAMAISLETRVPMLDHRVVEFAWRLPQAMKVRDGHSKWLLKQVLHRHVPPALMDRPKSGFGVPVREWIRGPLREWAEDLLSAERLRRDGFFNVGRVRKQWQAHLRAPVDGDETLWQLLAFQAWRAFTAGR